MPPQLEEALRNFAEARWRHPLLSPLSPELSDQWEPQPAPDDAPPVPAFAPTPGGEPGQQLSRAAEETLPDTQGAWIKGILAFTLVASATVPVMAGRWLVGGSSGVPWATMVIYVIGQPVLTRYGPLGHEGRPAVFLRRLWGLASVLSLGAVLSVTVPARPLTWADILGMVVLGIGGLLFAYGVGYARSGQRHGLEYNIVGFGTVLAGCSAAPAAAASHGAVAFAGYAVATLLVFAGAISAPRKVPDMTLAASVSATTAPRLTALERAWTVRPSHWPWWRGHVRNPRRRDGGMLGLRRRHGVSERGHILECSTGSEAVRRSGHPAWRSPRPVTHRLFSGG
ncbi:hypothetical protein SAZ11_36945 [Streptomyces sp. FXJ1.4098]|nr:hypothetical protein [Streptomyces sp. FXJ1.4098]